MSEVQLAARHPWYIPHLSSEERHHLADFFQLLLELARGVSVTCTGVATVSAVVADVSAVAGVAAASSHALAA